MLTYVLPLRCDGNHADHGELARYLEALSAHTEVIVADGSPDEVFAQHSVLWSPGIRHLRPDLGFANGKVDGVTTGLRAASHERVIVADDDVRYPSASLHAVGARLLEADLVVPQNVFEPMSAWHTRWDTARTLLNRALRWDYPGTLGVRRSMFLRMGGYDGNVLFENLELIRTVRAAGGRVVVARDVFIPRRPPSAAGFLHQRVRQAYDDLAQPLRLAVHLSLLPVAVVLAFKRRWGALAAGAAASVALAEVGRRRDGAQRVYPASASWFAPAWLGERAVCIWLALGNRVLRGGCPYRGRILRRAATPMAELRRRANALPQRAAGSVRSSPAA